MTRHAQADRLLELIGETRKPPSLHALTDLVRSFQHAVPFENISKLLRLEKPIDQRIPSLDEFLDNIERFQLGGTCLTNNPYFLDLLRHLGYDAALRSADMGEQMGVHTCIEVRLDPASFLVDVGFGAPFFEPIALHRLPVEIHQGPRKYRIAEEGDYPRIHVATIEGEEEILSYDVVPGTIEASGLGHAIDFSFRQGATFMSCLAITKHFPPDRTLTLRDLRLTERNSTGSSVTHFQDLSAAEKCVREQFKMPQAPLRMAARILSENCGVHPFGDAPRA